MAPQKRLRIAPLDDPPTASSSSDDDQSPSSKKPEDEVVDEEEDSEEEGEETDQNEEDDDEEEEGSSSEEEQVQSPSKNPPPSTPISNPKPDSGSESESGAESGSESGSESASEQEPTPPNPKIKPLASKPMKAQPQAQSTPVPARSGTKRANENGSKPAKKKTTAAAGGGSENEADGDGDVKMTGEDSKKMNPRVFTEEDEIAILKGLADFISKTGKDPMKDLVAFHSFVKKSIHGDATSEQLKRKVRGLKMKFKDGGSFTKEHDKKAFELYKKVWGNTEGNNGGNEGEENGKVNEKTPKSTKKEAPVRNNGSAKKEIVVKSGAGKDEGGVDKSLALSEMCKFGEAAGLSLLNKNAVERGMGLLEESKADEFDEGWRKVQIAEMELFVTRGQLLKDQTRIALDALKKKSIN